MALAAINLECIKSWARAFQFVGSILLVMLGIIRFITVSLTSPTVFILTIYYFVFAALLVIAEFQIKIVMKYFHFLYYGWGKAVLDIFLFTICFDTSINPFFQIPVAWFFAVAAIMFLIIAFAWKSKPNNNKEKKEEKKEEAKESDV